MCDTDCSLTHVSSWGRPLWGCTSVVLQLLSVYDKVVKLMTAAEIAVSFGRHFRPQCRLSTPLPPLKPMLLALLLVNPRGGGPLQQCCCWDCGIWV